MSSGFSFISSPTSVNSEMAATICGGCALSTSTSRSDINYVNSLGTFTRFFLLSSLKSMVGSRCSGKFDSVADSSQVAIT